jgi:hypothetical protein
MTVMSKEDVHANIVAMNTCQLKSSDPHFRQSPRADIRGLQASSISFGDAAVVDGTAA